MEKRKTYQEWVIDLFFNVLKERELDQNFLEHGYKYCLKDGAVCHYANTYWNGKENINMWQTNFSTKRYKGAENALLISAKAYDIIQQIKRKEEKLKDKNNHYQLRWEHITPNGYVYDRLLSLKKENITRKNVEECFRHHKIIILTTKEASVLDGKGEKFNGDDEKLLNEWAEQLSKKLDEDIKSLRKDGKGEFLRCKNFGSGLARIAHLYNQKTDIGFKLFINEEMQDVTIKEIYDYLESKDYRYEKE